MAVVMKEPGLRLHGGVSGPNQVAAPYRLGFFFGLGRATPEWLVVGDFSFFVWFGGIL